MRIGSCIAAGLLIVVAAGAVHAANGLRELTPEDKRRVAAASKFFQRGNDFAARGSLQRAKVEYEKALEVFPRHVDALYNLAIVQERLGDKAAAIASYRRYLEILPQDADAWTQLGVLYDLSNEKAAAEQAYRTAIAHAPDFGRAYHNLAQLLRERGQLDEALTNLQKFVALEEAAGRDNGDAYYSLATLYLQRGELKHAKANLQRALSIDPAQPLYHNALGDVYLAERAPELAISHYEKCLQREPRYAPAYSGLGDARLQLGQTAGAIEAYRRALELRPDYVLVHYKLGMALAPTDPAAARKHLETYLASAKNPALKAEASKKLEELDKQGKAP